MLDRRRFTLFLLVPLAVGVLWTASSCASRGQRYTDFITATPLAPNEYLVIGFLGGREPWDNEKRGVRKLALKLRSMELAGVHVETAENQKRALALQLVRKALDRNRDGQLDAAERRSVQLILYGQSFGGAAVVKLARELERQEIPVLLTVQVDSVGRGDAVIPPNVACAANLYQDEGLFIRGEEPIRAEDPARTTILGNFDYDYKEKDIDLSQVSWMKKVARTAHTKMDFDPEVWARVEGMILHAIRTSTCGEPKGN
jgi:hypothetical protein